MIHAISGKPRGGKTLYSLRLIVHELVYGTRTVVTNVGLKLGELNEYLQKTYPHSTVDLFKRLILVSDDEIKRFFTIRPHGFYGPKLLTKEQWKSGVLPDYSGCVGDGGVMYVMDEVHIAFNARAWMETGQDVLFYLSQHGKLGDTVVWITQSIGNVDKQFRSVTQDFTYIRNLSKEKMGLFNLPAIFTRQTYTSPATEHSQPMETGTFKLDVSGLASIYDTAKGVGIHGVSGDKGERRKGIHWAVPVVLVPLLLILAAKYLPPVLARVFVAQPAIAHSVPALPSPVVEEKKKVQPTHNVIEVGSNHTSNLVLTIVGIDRLSGYWRVMLSSGSFVHQIRPEDGLEKITTEYVTIRGTNYFYSRPQPGEFRIYEAPQKVMSSEFTEADSKVTVTTLGSRPADIQGSSRERLRQLGL